MIDPSTIDPTRRYTLIVRRADTGRELGRKVTDGAGVIRHLDPAFIDRVRRIHAHHGNRIPARVPITLTAVPIEPDTVTAGLFA